MLCCPPVVYDRKEIIMHFLHKILVHIPSAIDVVEETPRAEILNAVTCYARNETECFYERAYDWREDDSAGRWSDEYPQQAYLASEDLEWFMKELDEIQREQKYEIDFALKNLQESMGTNVAEIATELWNRNSRNYDSTTGATDMSAYYLHVLAQFLYGEYRCDSCFYNTKEYTARLYQSDLDAIRGNPENWALVMFDYHY